MELTDIFTYDRIIDAVRKCRKGVSWKGTVQYYSAHLPSEIAKIAESSKTGKFATGRFFRFNRMERGKLRKIQSVGISERVVQRTLCDYCLVPKLTSKFVYDNAACIKGKGMHFAIRRLKEKIHRYWINNGSEGYILQFDFHHYFETIPHDKLIKEVSKTIRDPGPLGLYEQLINDFKGDAGIGLGSQISQISALYYPRSIDNALSRMEGSEGYARYMDDGYVIAKDKETLRRALSKLRELSAELGLVINEKKTQIKRLDRPFEFLKCRFFLFPNGRIVVKPNRRNITKNRRKLRKLRALCDEGKITEEYAYGIFKSTIGGLRNYDCKRTRESYFAEFSRLFPKQADDYLATLKRKRKTL